MKRWNTPSGFSPFEHSAIAAIADQPHWVYEVYSPAGLCLYVGMTCDLERRTRSHRRRFGIDVIVRATEVRDRLAAERLEVQRIRDLRPAANLRRYGVPHAAAPVTLDERVSA